jgi:nucleoside-diphosphate-sugar epimerase
MKALITGGAGFVGLHLARHLLSRDYEVTLVDNFARGVQDRELAVLASESGATLVTVDLLDSDSLAGLPGDFDQVYHLAAIIGVQHVLDRPFDVLADNTRMLLAAIELARRQGKLDRFVFASTSEVYAGTLLHYTLPTPTPEDTPLAVGPLEEKRTSYMLSKIYGEALCRQSELPITLIRPHNFYGPRMGLSHVIPQLLERAWRAKDGDDFEVYSVDHSRTFAYIDDAIEFVRRAAESPACEGEVINVGNQEPEVAIGELAELVLRVVGRKLRIQPQPATPGSPLRRCPDMKKTMALTGYAPQVSLQDGIERTFNWYLENVFREGGVSAL